MNINYKLKTLQTENMTLDYFLVPWDTAIMGQAVAEIKHIEIRGAKGAATDYQTFEQWREQNDITLCSCRLPHDQLAESMFLETQGFRFIELNYHPRLEKLQGLDLPDDTILIEPANDQDRESLAEMAEVIFKHGRFHQDHRLGAALGNRRYKTWLINSFDFAHQKVFKCLLGSKTVAFFVVEYPEQDHCFWSLIGLAPGLQGQGLGKRVWQSMLGWHQKEGIDVISTSISSHNSAVFNLYVSMGFRFTAPHMTFHWRPSDCSPLI